MSREVLDMIGKKFEGRDEKTLQNKANATVQGKYEMSADELTAYEKAKANGDIQTMLAIKSGVKRKQQQSVQFDEVANMDIRKVSRELKTIDLVIGGLEKKYSDDLKQAKAEIESKFERQAEKLIKKGVTKGSRQFLILQDDFVREYEEIEHSNKFKAMRQEIQDLYTRRDQLDFMMEQYKTENADLIEEAKREKVKQTLKELDLI